MVLYLIDYENVKNSGLIGIDKIPEGDKAVVFYSPSADTISIEMHHTLMRSKCSIDFFKIRRGGKNFLDFQLATYLGYMMKDGAFTHAVIISRDQGFDSLIDFWDSSFAPSGTKLYRFVSIGAYLNYSFNRKTRLDEDDYAENSEETPDIPPYVEYETESEEIPEPVENDEIPAFEAETVQVMAEVTAPPETAETPTAANDNDVSEQKQEAFTQKPKRQRKRRNTDQQRKNRFQKTAVPNETTAPETKPEPVPQTETAAEQEHKTDPEDKTVDDILGKYPYDRRIQLINCVRMCEKKQDLYINLIKAFGKKKGCEYYHDLKSHYAELYNRV